MNTPAPTHSKIYHIVHINNLPSIVKDGNLFSDSIMVHREEIVTIGMPKIIQRRLTTKLSSYPDLSVGACVPFYFCPRSVMLFMFHQGNHAEITYTGGQAPVIHLVADLSATVQWANANAKGAGYSPT